MTKINTQLEQFKRCADQAPEGTYEQAKALNALIGETCDTLLTDVRALGLKTDNCDLIYHVEATIYDYIKKSNPQNTLFALAEGFGESLDGPAADRVLAQAARDRDFLRSSGSPEKTSLQHATDVPVICVDGPTASGKGSLTAALADLLGYHLLDSGALYRITALAAMHKGLNIELANEGAIAEMIPSLSIRFHGDQVFLDEVDVSSAIRTEDIGMNASTVSSFPKVRLALVDLQHSFCKMPGLVADGRDMGTVIFPQAQTKIFLTASAEQRAQRRYDQLKAKGQDVSLESITEILTARDKQDSTRATAPLKPADDAIMLDNSDMTVDESVSFVLEQLSQLSRQRPSESRMRAF